jgi:hypothetical protein
MTPMAAPPMTFERSAASTPMRYMTWSRMSDLCKKRYSFVLIVTRCLIFSNNLDDHVYNDRLVSFEQTVSYIAELAHLVLNPAVPYWIVLPTLFGCFSLPTSEALENISMFKIETPSNLKLSNLTGVVRPLCEGRKLRVSSCVLSLSLSFFLSLSFSLLLDAGRPRYR